MAGSLIDCAWVVDTAWLEDTGCVLEAAIVVTGDETLDCAVLEEAGAELEVGLEMDSELDDGVSVAGTTDRSELVSATELVLPGTVVGVAELDDGATLEPLGVEDEITTTEVDSGGRPVEDLSEAVSRAVVGPVVDGGTIIDSVEEGVLDDERPIVDTVGKGVLETGNDDTVDIGETV